MVTSMSNNRRRKPRTATTIKEITGLLMDESENSRQPFVLFDVSDNGFGLWTSEKLDSSGTIKVTLGKEYGGVVLNCDVVWSEKDDSKSGYLSGLEVRQEVPSNLYQFLRGE